MPFQVEVELFIADLDVSATTLARLIESLSTAERARGEVLGDAPQARWWLAEHGLRRSLLAERCGCPPEALEYRLGPEAKPAIAGGPHFSVSRAGAVALYAVSEAAEVGIDVESIPADPDDPELPRLARRLFSDSERAVYDATPPARRPVALTACWARKEAYGKALGTGLVFPLSGVAVWNGDDRPVRHGAVIVQEVRLAGGLGFAAALAVRCAPGTAVAVAGKPTRLSAD